METLIFSIFFCIAALIIIISIMAYGFYLILKKDIPKEESLKASESPELEKQTPETESFQAPSLLTFEKEPPEKEEAQTYEPPKLPYSTCGIASCVTSILVWIMIGLSFIAHEALQSKVKNFLLDPIGYTLERIFLGIFQPFVELAKAGVIASGAGMLIALILGIVDLLESSTKTTAILGCILSVFGLMPALSMIF